MKAKTNKECLEAVVGQIPMIKAYVWCANHARFEETLICQENTGNWVSAHPNDTAKFWAQERAENDSKVQ